MYRILFLSTSLLLCNPRQEGASRPFVELALRSLNGPDKKAAQRDLAAAIDRDYRAAYSAYERTKNPRAKSCLRYMLQLPAIEAAEIVLRGKLAEVETIQGGVVDYHWVIVHFTAVEVLRAPREERRAILRTKTLKVAMGTSQDAWLCALLRRDLERIEGTRTWVLRPRDLRYGDKERPRVLRVREYELLPAAALDAVRPQRDR